MIILSAVAVAADRINLSWTDDYASGPGYLLERAPSTSGPWAVVTTLGGTVRAYTDTGLAPSTAYAYRLSRVAEAVTANATTPSGVTMPSAPTGLTAIAVSSSQINLAWTDTSTNELGFRIDRWAGVWAPPIFVGANVTTYADTGLAASTAYTYQVRAYNTAGDSATTPYASATTGSTATMPTAPSNLVASAVSASQINLAWTDNATNETGFKVERATSSAGPWTQIAITGTNIVSYSSTGLSPSTTYFYRVRATNAAGDSGYSNTAGATTQAGGVPGEFLWAKRIGGVGSDVGYAVAVDGLGNVVMVGTFQGTVDFWGAPLTSAGTTDMFVVKYAPSGELIWAKHLGGSAGTGRANAVAVDAVGDVVVTGYFQGTVDFGGTPLTSAGGADVFVAKYAGLTGAHLWSERFGSTGIDVPNAVAVDAVGDVVVTGYFQGTVDFGGALLTSAGGTDIFVAKYAGLNGTPLWSDSFGGAVDDYGQSVAVDGSGNVVVTGYFQQTVDFGGGPLTSAGDYDIFVAKYSSTGGHLWSKRFGDIVAQKGFAVAADDSGNIFVTGFFLYRTDLGGGILSSAGQSDVFLLKLGP